MFDIAVRNATLVDGTGTRAYRASVYIKDGLIAKVDREDNDSSAKESINGWGYILAPGFIDVHTHDDVALIVEPEMPSKITQGITTIITGLCGYSPAPIADKAKIPQEYGILIPDETYRYSTFKAYLDKVKQAQPTVNYLPLVGHSTLRVSVMEDLHRPASWQEIEKMKNLLDECFEAGVVGLSSGLAYSMAQKAPAAELIELCEHIKQYDGAYVTHLRNEGDQLEESVDEALQIGLESGVPVIFSHHKAAGQCNHGKIDSSLARIDAARANQDVALDAYPYSFSSTALTLEGAMRGGEVIVTRSETMPDAAGKRLSDIAFELQMTLPECIEALQPAGALYYVMDPEDVRKVIAHDLCMIGSDGLPFDERPHPRLWGTFPKVLSQYVRNEGLFSIETAVRKMTGLAADVFGIEKRGYLREGYWADMVLFDYDVIRDRATAENPKQAASGIKQVWVNGKIAAIGTGQLIKTGRRTFPEAQSTLQKECV